MKNIINMPFIAFALLACVGCHKEKHPPYTLHETIYVDRLENNNYKLTLKEDGNWKIYQGYNNVNEIDWTSAKVLSSKLEALIVTNAKPQKRMFFAAVNEEDTLYVSEREIDMKNTVNFRDLGGIPTKEGKHIKWGLLFRSGDLPELSEEDLAYMKEIRIAKILDLRSTREIQEKPDMYPDGVSWVHIPIGNIDGKDPKGFFNKIKDADPETFDVNSLMEKFSVEFVNRPEDFKNVFNQLLEQPGKPLLFHCTAGKDRTGFSSAFILYALGVEKETILNEYMLSNYFRYKYNEEMVEQMAANYEIDPRILRPMMDVKKAYLQKGFDEIEAKYGSIDNYLTNQVGLDSLKIATLKKIYLQ